MEKTIGSIFHYSVEKMTVQVVIFCASPGSSKEDDSISNHTTALPSPRTWAFPLRFYLRPGEGFYSVYTQDKTKLR